MLGFECNSVECNSIEFNYKMNEIINKFLFAGDKFMPEMHLRQPKFTYSVCGPFTKETGDPRYIYKKMN